jgi:hypothetical protein
MGGDCGEVWEPSPRDEVDGYEEGYGEEYAVRWSPVNHKVTKKLIQVGQHLANPDHGNENLLPRIPTHDCPGEVSQCKVPKQLHNSLTRYVPASIRILMCKRTRVKRGGRSVSESIVRLR